MAQELSLRFPIRHPSEDVKSKKLDNILGSGDSFVLEIMNLRVLSMSMVRSLRSECR